jgi:Zn-dependent metalloprotease
MIKNNFGEKAKVTYNQNRSNRNKSWYKVESIGLKIEEKIDEKNIEKVAKRIIKEKDINDLSNIDFVYGGSMDFNGTLHFRIDQLYKNILVLDGFVALWFKNNELVSYTSCIYTDNDLKNLKIKNISNYDSTFDSVYNIVKRVNPYRYKRVKKIKPILVLAPAKTGNNYSHCICWKIATAKETIWFNTETGEVVLSLSNIDKINSISGSIYGDYWNYKQQIEKNPDIANPLTYMSMNNWKCNLFHLTYALMVYRLGTIPKIKK